MKNLFLLITLLSLNAVSQDLKTYNGQYEDSYRGWGNGQAIYQYFENENYERIYHGNFSYESTLITNDRNSVTTIQGRFENNKKIGEWIYNREYKKLGYQTTIKGKYKNGLKDGKWSFYQKGYNNRSKSGITYYINFKRDTLIGEINLDGLKGTFNREGGYSGKWIMNTGSYENIAEFEDNLLLKFIYRRTSTGEIYSKYLPLTEKNNLEKDSSGTLYTKELLSKVDFVDIFGISEDKVVYQKQVHSIQTFIKEIKSKINSLQEDWNKFLFLDNLTILSPEVLISQKSSKKNSIEKIVSKAQSKKLEYLEEIGLDGDKNYRVGGRRVLNKQKFIQDCNKTGIVVITVEVDQNGRVLTAKPRAEGTTSYEDCLLEPAKRAALNTRFNSDYNAPQKQLGSIIYSFKLSE